jgi:hypothetical protein
MTGTHEIPLCPVQGRERPSGHPLIGHIGLPGFEG